MENFWLVIAIVVGAVGVIAYLFQHYHAQIAAHVTSEVAAAKADVASVKADVAAVKDAVTK